MSDMERTHLRVEYVASLHVDKTKDEFGTDRFFVADVFEDWIAGPYDTSDLAWAEIAKRHAEAKV